MLVVIKNRGLGKLVDDRQKLESKYGKIKAERLLSRLDDLLVTDDITDLQNLPGRYHELKGDRSGQWACDLEHPYRLILEFCQSEEGLTANIIDIVDYH